MGSLVWSDDAKLGELRVGELQVKEGRATPREGFCAGPVTPWQPSLDGAHHLVGVVGVGRDDGSHPGLPCVTASPGSAGCPSGT
jgi:hypothetical protein